MGPPPKKQTGENLTDAEVDQIYGLEPVIGDQSTVVDRGAAAEFVVVGCPYCGETFETSADTSEGSCKYVEDCQICCQPIEMELRVDDDGALIELATRRGDS